MQSDGDPTGYGVLQCSQKQAKAPTDLGVNKRTAHKMAIDTGFGIKVIDQNTFAKLRNTKMEGKFRALAESRHMYNICNLRGGCFYCRRLKQPRNSDLAVSILIR